jgi:hypothetical protein
VEEWGYYFVTNRDKSSAPEVTFSDITPVGREGKLASQITIEYMFPT